MTEPEREPELWQRIKDERDSEDGVDWLLVDDGDGCWVLRRYALPEELKAALARITELEAQIPPPLTEAELAELTRSSEKLYSAEARVAELESSNGYPLAAEWRGKCEAALVESNHYKTWHRELQTRCVQQQAQLAEAREILRDDDTPVRQYRDRVKKFLARTAPASDKPEPPAQERKGDSPESLRPMSAVSTASLSERRIESDVSIGSRPVKSPGSESVTTAVGLRFPHPDPKAVWTGWSEEFQCDCYAKETTELLCDYTINHPTSSDWENERYCMELSSKMLRRKEAWRRAVEWRDKQKAAGDSPPKSTLRMDAFRALHELWEALTEDRKKDDSLDAAFRLVRYVIDPEGKFSEVAPATANLSSIWAAAGPKTERCPHCNCSSIYKEQDRDDEGNVTNEWAECLYCGEQWSWQDKPEPPAQERKGDSDDLCREQ